MARGNFDVLPGLPRRRGSAHLGSAPRKRREHPPAPAGKHRGRCSEVGAAHVERLSRVPRGLDRCRQRLPRRFSPARAVKADRVDHAAVAADAHAQQRCVEFAQLTGNALRRRTRLHRRSAKHLLQPVHCAVNCLVPRTPFGAALRNEQDQCPRVRCTRSHRISPHDRALERLQRRDLAHAHVSVAGRTPERGRRDGADAEQDGEEHGHDRDARSDRKVQQRRGPGITHGRHPGGSR